MKAICQICGKEFEMGWTGTIHGCDECSNVSRLPDGTAYKNDEPYQIRRPVRNQGGAGVRPGDFAVLHPNRGK